MIRKGFGLEERAVTTLGTFPPVGQSPAIPDGYGLPGMGGWDTGMVWRPGLGWGSVTVDSAMQMSAVFGCLRLLTSAVAMLPIDTFIRTGRIREDYPKPDYLGFEIPQDSRRSYLSQLMLSWLTAGDTFTATPRDELGVPLDLVPLDPGMIEDVYRKGGRKFFRVLGREFDERDIMHIPGLGPLPGQLRGISPLTAAREVIDGGRKAQEFGRSFMGNHAVPPAVIELPDGGGNDATAMQDRAIKIAETWQATHGGTSNAGKVGVLIGGAKLNTIAISPQDAEWLESKRFGVSEIARFFGVPPHLIADASNSTSWGSGLAEQNLAFGQFSLQPWIDAFEEGHTRLLTTHGLRDVFVKLNLDAKLRSSPAERYAVHAISLASDMAVIDERRALEDLPPVPWGQERPSTLRMGSTDPDAPLPPREVAEMIQKIYLGVGKVITDEEAREILNRAGAGLTGPGPTGGS